LVVGFANGEIPQLPMNLALLKGASLVGVFFGAFVKAEPQSAEKNLRELMGMLAAGKLKPLISKTYPLHRAADALNDVMQRRAVGKIVLLTS
jgi:NADPH2:quinone reductase